MIGAVDRVRKVDFPVVLRGYDRAAVDAYVAEVAQLVAELEATRLPESVVQRALDEVGDETSEILKRAHAAAEEVTTRSRFEAAARLQRAEREAEAIRREADEQIGTLDDDVRAIWQERQRLIEDLRQLAEDVLALADDALEQAAPAGAPAEEEDVPTAASRAEEEEDVATEASPSEEEAEPVALAPVDDEPSQEPGAEPPTTEQAPAEDESERPRG